MSDWPSLCSYMFFKDTLVPIGIGLIGFGGVGWSIRSGAKLAREQHATELEEQRDGLRQALSAELEINLETLEHNYNTSKNTEGENDILVPLETRTKIFDTLTDKLDILTAAEVKSVTSAYIRYKAIPERLKLGIFLMTREVFIVHGSLSIPNEYIFLVTSLLEHAIKDHKNALLALSSRGRKI